MTSFADLDLDPRVLKAVADAGYRQPTPIQADAIPYALEGRDVLGIAQTGTGKTASFTLPIITALLKGRARARMPRSLILCPTRELASQIADSLAVYSRHVRLSRALLIGGVSFAEQDQLITKGVDVLIATPGRLLDHFERGRLLLTGVQIMVVDEADRMLDMGFIPDIERIFRLTPFTRQTLFFSATMAPEITRITKEFLQNPARVEVAPQASMSENTAQHVCVFRAGHRSREAKEKRIVLRSLIREQGDRLTNGIVFCNRKSDVDIVARSLQVHGFSAQAIHGDLDQKQRMRVLDSFRNGDIVLLIASDVAARGLDIPNVSHIFNFDVPNHAENYVHRIGRTGRAGRSGSAFTICLSPRDDRDLSDVERLIKQAVPRLALPQSAEEEIRMLGSGGRGRPRSAARANRPSKSVADKPCSTADEGRKKRGQRSRQIRDARPAPPKAPDGPVQGMGSHVPDFLKTSFTKRPSSSP
ncbi:MAG: DEAD/DEAH box helicase [Paracoccaceae bacterium]|nr:DEAD/DEAH box helicase [Paracoccaceae bacterium]